MHRLTLSPDLFHPVINPFRDVGQGDVLGAPLAGLDPDERERNVPGEDLPDELLSLPSAR